MDGDPPLTIVGDEICDEAIEALAALLIELAEPRASQDAQAE